MGDAYQIKDQYALHFLTFQVVGWMDIFSRQSYRDVVVDSFNFCRKEKHLKIRAWVIMSNHVHCILSSGTGRLSDTVGEMKGFTSREMLKLVEHGSESRKNGCYISLNTTPAGIRVTKSINYGRTKTMQKNCCLWYRKRV